MMGYCAVFPWYPLLQSYETAYAKMLPVLLKVVATMEPPTAGYPLRRCLASLSQKWKVPSEPAVLKVPWMGWKEMSFTAWTVTTLLAGGSRWHLKEKLDLLRC